MPPVSEPALSVKDFDSRHHDRPKDLYAVLHLCTNKDCHGSTVGYYTGRRNAFYFLFHRPRFYAYEAPQEVPERPRVMLQDANDARNSPVACVAAAARAVEAMMAEMKYDNRSMGLKKRIDKAVDAGDLPPAMGDWANEVREIGNVTHTDETPEPLSTNDDATRALLFANTLADYLFVMRARISKARKPDEDE